MRFNPRIILFASVTLALVGFPAYVFIDEKLSGGIKDRGDFLEVNLKAMSSFEFDQQNGRLEDVPEKWRKLDGKRIEVEGEMYKPDDAGSGRIQSFDLVYSIATCCLTSAPKIQHFVLARPQPGVDVAFHSGLVRVTGTLRVKVLTDNGVITRVFRLDVDSVKPV